MFHNVIQLSRYFLLNAPVLFIILFGSALPALTQPNEPWSKLLNKAQNQGHVRVIVRLAEDAAVSKNLSTPSARSNRKQAVRSLQEKFIRDYETSGFRADHYKRFKFFPFLAMSVDASALQALQSSSLITGIEEDTIEHASLISSVPLIGGDEVISQGYDGTGWAVAILDTGVDKTHSFFGGRVVSEACFSSNDSFSSASSVCPGGVEESTAVDSGVNCDVNDPSLTPEDCDHGTHVAGIASGSGTTFSGVAPASDIIAIQVFSKFNSPSSCFPFSPPCVASFRSDQIKGLEHVLSLTGTLDIASANMSLGGGGFSSPCDASESLRKTAIDNLRAVNVATVIASGNNGSDNSISTPACISTAISVGSTTKTDSISSFSNRADFLSLMAPGSSINSSVPGENFRVFNGTSMAAPHVAGTWAVLKQAMAEQGQQGSVDEILAALQTTGTPILDSSTGITYSRINIDEALPILTVPRAHNDFNADSNSDLLFVNDSGTIANGQLVDSILQTQEGIIQIDPAIGWILSGTGDFNGDNKSDLLLYNTTTGELRTVWLDGATILSDQTAFTLNPSLGAAPQGVGDFDGDNRDEILVHNPANGFTAIIFLDQSGIASSFDATTMMVDTANNWTLQKTGDFNGDNKTDLLTYNTVSGATAFYQMDGFNVTTVTGILTLDPATGWLIEETGDFNGNGNTDILIFHASGAIAIITMEDGLLQSIHSPGGIPADNEIVNAGRYDSDNRDDLLLFNTVTGDVLTALQDGAQITTFNGVLNLEPSSGWKVHSGKP